MSKVILYSADWCPFCVRAKRLLEEKKIDFKEVNVDEHPNLRQEITAKTGHKTIPQIFINDQFIGGFSELSALNERGELDQMLGIK
jgi:glutaredoxin 3